MNWPVIFKIGFIFSICLIFILPFLIWSIVFKRVLDILVSPQSAAQGIGAAVENILLAATEMGYGTCYMTGPTHAKAELEELIGFEKPGFELMSMIALGVAADETPAKPPRKPLEDVVTFID